MLLRSLTILALLTVILSVLIMIGSGPGTRFGIWGFGTGLTLFSYAAMGGLVGGIAAGIAALMHARRSPVMLRTTAVAAVLGLGMFAIAFSFKLKVDSLPYIHDITTDLKNPPAFDKILPKRDGALNPPEYPGEEVALKQLQAYPDIQPVITPLSPDKAFEKSLAVASDLGWEVAGADSENLRIEGTDTTFWFGFKDDIVVRISPSETQGSRIDVRSKSRVGLSDVGANAARIRKFSVAFKE